MDGLRIRLFGGLSLERSGRFVPPIPSRTGRSLFAYLVTRRHLAPPSRDLLAGMFWAENSETQARRRLSHTLWQIQSALSEIQSGENYVIASPTSVRFNAAAEHWLDVDAFDATLASFKDPASMDTGSPAGRMAELDAALELYKGDFLAGYYEDWVGFEQDRLRQTLLRGLEHAIRLSKSLGDLEGALRYGRRLTINEPLREEAHREVMRLTFLLDRPNEALAQYDRCRSILADELNTRPDGETEALRAQIDTGRAAPVIPFSVETRSRLFDSSQRIPLVGRKQERAALVAQLENALAGRSGLVYLDGEAGLGKTRLLEECAEDAHWRGLSVLWSGFGSGAPVRPFHGFRAALEDGLTPLRIQQLAERIDDASLAELANLIPAISNHATIRAEPKALEGEAERFRLLEALLKTLRTLTELTPTLFVLDDYHTADPDTLAALDFLARHGGDLPLLICVAYRRSEAERSPQHWAAIRELATIESAHRITLSPFGSRDTGDMLRVITPGATGHDLADRLHTETGGNPLFVLETLRALHERQVADSLKPPSGAVPEDATVPMTATISDLITRRLSRHTAEAMHVARVLATLAEPSDPDLVETATGGSRTGLLDSLDELVSSGVLRSKGGRFSFSHEQLRKVVYDTIDWQGRSEIHRSVGLALERFGRAEDSTLAHHFTLAGDAERSFRYHIGAGETALRLRAPASARLHLETALDQPDLESRSGLDVCEAALLLAEILDVQGETAAQRASVELASSRTGGDALLDARVALARARLLDNSGDLDDASRWRTTHGSLPRRRMTLHWRSARSP